MTQMYDEELRQELAVKYNAPFGTKQHMLFVDNPGLGKVRSSAKALLRSGEKLPEQRKLELEAIVEKHYGVVTDDILREAANLDVKEANKHFTGLHGERVVRAVSADGQLADFARLWRQRFLDKMKPRYLPPMWSVDHNLHKIPDADTHIIQSGSAVIPDEICAIHN